MQTISLFQAKTHLSRMVDDLLSGKEDRIVIARRGKPAVCMISLHKVDISKRIGLAKGRFDIPEDIDATNSTIAAMFTGKGEA
jgi:antitoxin (DNA-binding transcriptional repressor) of toxin-antitoxin stability system